MVKSRKQRTIIDLTGKERVPISVLGKLLADVPYLKETELLLLFDAAVIEFERWKTHRPAEIDVHVNAAEKRGLILSLRMKQALQNVTQFTNGGLQVLAKAIARQLHKKTRRKLYSKKLQTKPRQYLIIDCGN
jgi:hypothetical protein